jgi:hypothetical protein
MAKKPSKKKAPELFLEPESDDQFAYIAGYTSGGSTYGITWEEQEEIERRAAARNSATPPEQKEPVSLTDIVQEMQIISDTMTVYFQRSTGKFVTISDEYIHVAESGAPLDDHPEWEQEVIRETAEFLAREDDCDDVPLPTRYDIHEYAIMERFCSTVENRNIANDLFRAIAGKGAFRRFKDTLQRHGIEKKWYAYKDEAYKEIAREWCEEHHVNWRE